LGAASNGVAALLGLAAARCLSSTVCVLYIAACAAEFANDAIRSWRWLRWGIGPYAVRLQSPVVLTTTVFAVAGTMLALRLYQDISEGDVGEKIPLVAKAAHGAPAEESAKEAQPPAEAAPQSHRGAIEELRSDGSRGQDAGAHPTARAAPFQAIFQATIPRSPRVPPSQRRTGGAKEVEAAALEKMELIAAAKSGDGTIANVGVKVGGKFRCPDCRQQFESKRARQLHWKFVHNAAVRDYEDPSFAV